MMIKMSNPILIHINRMYHIPLDSIVKIVQKKHGSIYVYFIDEKSTKPKIAIAKQTLSNLLTVINNYKIMAGKAPLLGIIEK
jgi:hypothetical protein